MNNCDCIFCRHYYKIYFSSKESLIQSNNDFLESLREGIIIYLESSHLSPTPTPLNYGTAGFRCNHTLLPFAMFCIGFIAAYRSMFLKKIVGLMITASHNPENDNGVKIVDPNGEMLISEWESWATMLVNNHNIISNLQNMNTYFPFDLSYKPQIVIGRDTRKSSSPLMTLILDGARFLNASIIQIGEVTTPILHWIVQKSNNTEIPPTVNDYYISLSHYFHELIQNLNITKPFSELYIDCSFGVGTTGILSLSPLISDILTLLPFNLSSDTLGHLNENCGAEFVQKNLKLPINAIMGKRCCSFDGDADRIVYWTNNNSKLILLDGDKITSLISNFLLSLISNLNIPINIGVVQTAYANGASTNYLNELKIPISCVKTGVKHLHQKATSYDIGIYFEANGHGTVFFHPNFLKSLKQLIQLPSTTTKQKNIINTLFLLSKLINQSVGDSISDMLLIELILSYFNWDIYQWDAIYHEYPSCQLKVSIKDRNLIKTTNAERTITQPALLQEKIDKLVSEAALSNNGKVARAFVRPSGTEDVVRVYAETSSFEKSEELAKNISLAVTQIC